MTFYQEKKELFSTHYYIKVLSNNPIDPMFNFPEVVLSHVLEKIKKLNLY
jgi:hypothetical protein